VEKIAIPNFMWIWSKLRALFGEDRTVCLAISDCDGRTDTSTDVIVCQMPNVVRTNRRLLRDQFKSRLRLFARVNRSLFG